MAFLLSQLLAEAATRAPGQVGLVDGEREFTYEELDRWSDTVAVQLMEKGVRPSDRVALYLGKSAEAVAGLYGAMKAGAAYVPVDAESPQERARFIVQDSGTSAIVASGTSIAAAEEIAPDGVPVVPAEAAEPGSPQGAPSLPARVDTDLAYILYTSGSTGEPKGVMLSHRNCLVFVEWAARKFGLGMHDRVSSHAPLHFDLSTFDIFAAAIGASTVVLVPPRTSHFPGAVASFIRTHGITTWYSVPSILTMMVLRGGLDKQGLPSLRNVIFAGEVFPVKHLRELMRLVPDAKYCNLYGPTETNVCTYYDVPPLPEERTNPIPIGRPIDNVETVVMGEDGPVAPGKKGELYVRGGTVMHGYWGDPEKTAARLIPNPWNPALADLVYRTGDIVSLNEDGDLIFFGRADSQIKSRGYRIELGEIETVLHSHPEVHQVAAVPVPDELAGNLIRAYVVAGDVSPDEMRAFVAARLPRYMVPDEIEVRESLPKTSTGKVDRRRLQG